MCISQRSTLHTYLLEPSQQFLTRVHALHLRRVFLLMACGHVFGPRSVISKCRQVFFPEESARSCLNSQRAQSTVPPRSDTHEIGGEIAWSAGVCHDPDGGFQCTCRSRAPAFQCGQGCVARTENNAVGVRGQSEYRIQTTISNRRVRV